MHEDSHANVVRTVSKGDKKYLTESYPGLFDGPNAGEKLVRLVILVALVASAILAIGILALRVGTEGLIAGVAFGAFALVLCVASFANSWDVSCEIGERLDNLRKDVETARDDATAACEARVIQEYRAALATAANIRATAAARGLKCAAAVERQFWATMTASGGVTGYGQKNGSDRLSFDLEGIITEFERAREQPNRTASDREQTPTRSTGFPARDSKGTLVRVSDGNGHSRREVPPPDTTFGA